ADCTPVLLALTENGIVRGVMAIHAGWRGTALKIVEKAIPELLVQSKAKPAKAKLYAAIGPCISREKFEVEEDVIQAFPHALSQGLAQPFRKVGNKQKYQFDLAGENLLQLRNSAAKAGLDLETDSLGLCTVSDPEIFPSFRRDRESLGRILSYIAFSTDHTSAP
ncbi:MAG: polyphenol oxidase family protein, partial [Bdellovibrionota bacterium]